MLGSFSFKLPNIVIKFDNTTCGATFHGVSTWIFNVVCHTGRGRHCEALGNYTWGGD